MMLIIEMIWISEGLPLTRWEGVVALSESAANLMIQSARLPCVVRLAAFWRDELDIFIVGTTLFYHPSCDL